MTPSLPRLLPSGTSRGDKQGSAVNCMYVDMWERVCRVVLEELPAGARNAVVRSGQPWVVQLVERRWPAKEPCFSLPGA